MKILIVEDNLSNMKLVSSLLEMAGYTVFQAYNAEEGISIARGKLPDLILMDIHLPGMDGLTATRVLKSKEDTCNIPIIAMSSFAMTGDKKNAREAGCDHYITKPFDYREFLSTVKSFLKNQTQIS